MKYICHNAHLKVDVLKFEYLTQLLVDANYIPIILKLLQTQDIERIVNCKTDRENLEFVFESSSNNKC
jgi:hypothetical protein